MLLASLSEYKPLALGKTGNGVWSVQLPSLTPDIYTYDFTVDGVKTFDPKNPWYKEGENGLSNLFEVPGKESDYCTVKNVPHGKLESVDALLDKYDLKYKTANYPAGHTFVTWRHNLYEFAPLLFN